MLLKPEETTLIAGFGAAVITAVVTLVTVHLNRKSEERKHFRSLVMNVAIERWKKDIERVGQKGGPVFPVDVHVIYMARFCEIFLDGHFTKESIEEGLKEVHEIAEIVTRLKLDQHEAFKT